MRNNFMSLYTYHIKNTIHAVDVLCSEISTAYQYFHKFKLGYGLLDAYLTKNGPCVSTIANYSAFDPLSAFAIGHLQPTSLGTRSLSASTYALDPSTVLRWYAIADSDTYEGRVKNVNACIKDGHRVNTITYSEILNFILYFKGVLTHTLNYPEFVENDDAQREMYALTCLMQICTNVVTPTMHRLNAILADSYAKYEMLSDTMACSFIEDIEDNMRSFLSAFFNEELIAKQDLHINNATGVPERIIPNMWSTDMPVSVIDEIKKYTEELNQAKAEYNQAHTSDAKERVNSLKKSINQRYGEQLRANSEALNAVANTAPRKRNIVRVYTNFNTKKVVVVVR